MHRLAAFFLCLCLLAPMRSAPATPAARRGAVSVTEATLPNGLRIVVLRDALAPVVSTWLNFEAGADDEPITGLAHAQEHMFFRGSASLSGTQADEIAGFTGDEDNADTQNEITQYFHLVPAQDLDLALHLDAARLRDLLDSQADWNQERGAIEQEVTRDNSDADYRLYVRILHHLMAGTVYADDGLGTLQSFGHQIEAAQLRRFFGTWYHPNNAIYVIAGDVDPAETIAAVRRLFGAMPAAALPARRVGGLGPLTAASFSDASDKSTTSALVAYRYPGYADSDYAASVVLTDVLNSRRGALAALVAEGKAISAEADTSEYPAAGFVELASTVPVSTAPSLAIHHLESVIAAYRKSGVPADLVTAAKAREVAQLEIATASIENLAATWSQALAVEHRNPNQDLAAIAAVTPADVTRVVRRYLDNATATVAYAVPKKAASEAEGGSAGSESAKGEQTKIAPLPAWAQAALQRLRVPERTINPTLLVLRNGLHVIVQPEHASRSVAVVGTVVNNPGLEEPSGRSGVAGVVEKLLPYGTRTYGRVAYQAALDRIAATVQTGFTFSLTVPSEHFDRGLQLLADDELHPALSSRDFAIVRDERVAELTGEEQSPDRLAAVAAAQALYPPSDPARRFAHAAEVRQLTLSDARAFYTLAYRPDLTTIAIVGDVTPAEARRAVERYFGSWKRKGKAPRVFAAPVADNGTSRSTVPATGRIQDAVRLEETLALANDDPAIAPLQVANTVLSGDFSSMLIRDLRVTTGLVYSVRSALNVAKSRATFSVEYGCSPRNVVRAEALVARDLRRLQAAPLDAERLERAKSRLLSTIPIAEQSYDGLGRQLVSYISQGLALDEDEVLAKRELTATPEAVRDAMRRWIRPDGFIRVVEGPAPR